MELPPRTRRIRHSFGDWFGEGGTTSAHAENTHRAPQPRTRHRNYLRARGEYVSGRKAACKPKELPPRTRRIHPDFNRGAHKNGTTSAHAENTAETVFKNVLTWNYLRARGEYSS